MISESTDHQYIDNDFSRHFWGRANIETGCSMYYYSKDGKIQQAIRALKYQGKKEVGIKLGSLFGSILRDSPLYKNIELILPVPLHPLKAKNRGYNQCDQIAKGLSESMMVPWRSEVIVRKRFTETQTKKSRNERIENVRDAFEVKDREIVKGKKVLVVDDVLTTGATLEACVNALSEIEDIRIYCASLAMGQPF